MRVVLTIAGSDSIAGAGIQADLKTFAALGVYGASAITAVTSQNTAGVGEVFAVPPQIVRSQIDCVAEDTALSAVKTGMRLSPGSARGPHRTSRCVYGPGPTPNPIARR